MKRKFKLFLITFILLTFTQLVHAQTQGQMNGDASQEYNSKKFELEGIINRIKTLYSKDKDFLEAFQKSNDIWLKYRDAQFKMRYPSNNPKLDYGSIYPMCFSDYLTQLTKKRIVELRLWADGLKEGEACCGSVHFH